MKSKVGIDFELAISDQESFTKIDKILRKL